MTNERKGPAEPRELAARFKDAELAQSRLNLPEFYGRRLKDKEIDKWVGDQLRRIEAAIIDADEVLFEQALGSWRNGCARINEIIAEEYRLANQDPETWDLRYFRWMTKVVFMRFECPLGEFYLVPRRPRRRPTAKHWYTAEEMIDMLESSATIKTVTLFGALPSRPEDLPAPVDGEKILHMDFTGDEAVIKYERRGHRYGNGKGVR